MRGDRGFEGPERSGFLLRPDPGLALLGEVEEWPGEVGEGLDEAPVEVREADEHLHVLLVLRRRPGGDSGDFDRVHLDTVVRDNHPEVFDRRLLELTLLRAQV